VHDNLFGFGGRYDPTDGVMSDAHLAQASGDGRVYLYDNDANNNGGYRWIVDAGVFNSYGFSWRKILWAIER
jgi:hypothetical protein